MSGLQLFVQVGPLTSYMKDFIAQAANLNSTFKTTLITDQKSVDIDFVDIVSLDLITSREAIAELTEKVRAAGFDPSFRNGYWVKIFTRFLAISKYLESATPEGPVVHLECDVASYVSGEVIKATLESFKSSHADVFIPFIDSQTACPSIILSRESSSLMKVCDFVLENLGRNIGESDMSLLAYARECGLVASLPTLPNKTTIVMPYSEFDSSNTANEGRGNTEASAMVIFDAAAVGQYLFGIDPRISNGLLTPGYMELRGELDISQWRDWRIVTCKDHLERVAFNWDNETFIVAQLHVHAKIRVPMPASGNPFWDECLGIANGLRVPKSRIYIRWYLLSAYRNSDFFGFRVVRAIKNKISSRQF
ncbi:MAG: hypothetical protein F2923_07485 [Actinobacteria bacterium]|uniref:Unannotated protein n=1 Tax=freshwater metagenome TaxID=449393 RepID=A0A6J7SLK0_9ZZZZ|nr:hypothetical protein [Actinomycetota bacterium]